MGHGYEETGCRCNGCVWDMVVQYRPLIGSVANRAARRNPWAIRDFEDLYSYLVAEAFSVFKSMRSGPPEQGKTLHPANFLRQKLEWQVSDYLKAQLTNKRRLAIATVELNPHDKSSELEDPLDDFHEAETRLEYQRILKWLREHYVDRTHNYWRRRQRETTFKRFEMWLDGLTLDQIAKKENVSRQAVFMHVNRVKEYAQENRHRFAKEEE